MGALATAVIIVVVLLLIAIAIVWYLRQHDLEDAREKLARGCEPLSWGRTGIPTLWRCPTN